jgi:hypothetical protein
VLPTCAHPTFSQCIAHRASNMDTSYLAQQVNTIVGQLHGLFDEIGVPNHDREAREEEVRDTATQPCVAPPC